MGERYYEPRGREYDRAEDDRFYMRGGRGRDLSDDRFDRRYSGGPSRGYDEDFVRDNRGPERRPTFPEEEPRYMPRREPPPMDRDYDRRMMMEREREYPTSPRRPTVLRRPSSVETYDRRPLRNFYEREEYPPPARREDIYREDYRVPPYKPLPQSRGLPPPRRSDDRAYYDDIKIAEPDRYGDDDYRSYPERVREREVIRDSRDHRDRSRESRATRRRDSPSSVTTSRSSSSDGGTTVRNVNEYPKKGKTRIPARLISKRALIDLEYPYVEEGNTIIVQKALGQDNIDELLKLSEDYKKTEIMAARSSAGNLAEERREEYYLEAPPPMSQAPPTQAPVYSAPMQPVYSAPTQAPVYSPAPPTQAPAAAPPAPSMAPAPAPAPAPIVVPPPAPGPVIVDTAPPRGADYAESESSSATWESYHHHHYDQGRSNSVPGPTALVERARSRSRSGRDIRSEIKALEKELAHRPKHGAREGGGRELVHAERLANGELVLYEEERERIVGAPKPARIEKDKRGPPPGLVRAMLSTLT